MSSTIFMHASKRLLTHQTLEAASLTCIPLPVVYFQLPPPGLACKCISSGVRCDGEITSCADPNSKWCKQPAMNLETCLQGRGDCDGYGDDKTCDCDHHNGFGAGCIISKKAPDGVACDCKSHGVSCSGEVTLCKQVNIPGSCLPCGASCMLSLDMTCLGGVASSCLFTNLCKPFDAYRRMHLNASTRMPAWHPASRVAATVTVTMR